MTNIETRIRTSEKARERNDQTLMTATNHKQPWTPDELEHLIQRAGDVKPELIATEIGRSYYGVSKRAEIEGISLETGKHITPTQIISTNVRRIKVHKITYKAVPRFSHGKPGFYMKKIETTTYEQIDRKGKNNV